MKQKGILIGFITLLLLMTSCSTRKKIVYLNNMEQGKQYEFDMSHEATIHRNDRLAITVSSKHPELALPFNAQGNSVQVGADGSVATSPASPETVKGYRVDPNGNIDFPILGTLHVEGMKVSEVTEMIKQKIIDGNYIKDPQVFLEFLNFKYTVLGAVTGNGTYSVTDDRITLLEAIANAGDLAGNADIGAVNVIREIDGKRQVFVHDLRSTDLFTSPCYYLQQNDIVYVEPKYKKKDKEERGFQIATLLVSIASVITSIFWVLK